MKYGNEGHSLDTGYHHGRASCGDQRPSPSPPLRGMADEEKERVAHLWYLHTEAATSSLNEWLRQLTNEQLTQLIKSYRVTARRVTLQLCTGIRRFFYQLYFLRSRHVAISQKLGGLGVCMARCVRSPDLLTRRTD